MSTPETDRVTEVLLPDDNVLTIGGPNNPNPKIEIPAEVSNLLMIGVTRERGPDSEQGFPELTIASSGIKTPLGNGTSRSAIVLTQSVGGDEIEGIAASRIVFRSGGAINASGIEADGAGFSFSPGITYNANNDSGTGNFQIDLTANSFTNQTGVPIALTVADGGSGYPDGIWYDLIGVGLFIFVSENSYAQVESVTVLNGQIVDVGPVIGALSNGAFVGDVATESGFVPYANFDGSGITSHATCSVDAISGTVLSGSFSVLSDHGGISLAADGTIGLGLDFDTGSAGQVIVSAGAGAPAAWGDISGGGGGGDGGGASGVTVNRYTTSDGDTLDFTSHTSSELEVLSITSDADIAASTILFPAANVADQTFGFVYDFNVAALTCTPDGGDTIQNSPTSAKAGQSIQYVSDGAGIWSRISAGVGATGPTGPSGGGGGGGGGDTVLRFDAGDPSVFDFSTTDFSALVFFNSTTDGAQISSLALTFPQANVADQSFGFVCDQDVLLLSCGPPDGSTIENAPNALVTGQAVRWVSDGAGKWKRDSGFDFDVIVYAEADDGGTFDARSTGINLLVLKAETDLSGYTVNFPEPVLANHKFAIVCDHNIETIVVSTSDYNFESPPAGLIAGQQVQWVYESATTTYKLVNGIPGGPTGATGPTGASGGGGGSSTVVISEDTINFGDYAVDDDSDSNVMLLLMNEGDIAYFSVAFPPGQIDQRVFTIVSNVNITSLAIRPKDGSSDSILGGFAAPIQLIAGRSVQWVYSISGFWMQVLGEEPAFSSRSVSGGTARTLNLGFPVNTDFATNGNNFSQQAPDFNGLTIFQGTSSSSNDGGGNATAATLVFMAGDAVSAAGAEGSHGGAAGDLYFYAGAAYVSDVSGGNTYSSGNIYFYPGREVDPVPVAFTINDGGSGYMMDGATLADGTFADVNQTLSFYAHNDDENSHAYLALLTFSDGQLVKATGVYAPSSTATVGDIFALDLAQGSAYPNAINTTPATLVVAEVASHSDGGGVVFVCPAASSSIMFGPHAEIFLGDGSGHTAGSILLSQGDGAPAVFSEYIESVLRVEVIDGNNYELEGDIPSLFMLQASVAIDNYDIDFSDGNTPLHDQQMRVSSNQDIATFTFLNGTFDNVPSSLTAFQEIAYVYNGDSSTWERIR